jgi:hypothetical protein
MGEHRHWDFRPANSRNRSLENRSCRFAADLRRLCHCSHADAMEAAAVQTVAQTPSDDNRMIAQKAFLVSAKAASRVGLWARDGRRGDPCSSTEQACSERILCSISHSHHGQLGDVSWWPLDVTGHLDLHQTALTLTTFGHGAVYGTSKYCPPRLSNRI